MKTVIMLFFASILAGGIKGQQNFTIEEAKEGVSHFSTGYLSFVNSIKPIVSDNLSTFDNFRGKLMVCDSKSKLPIDTEELLKITYELIKKGASDKEIIAEGLSSFIKMVKAGLEKGDVKNYSATLNDPKNLFGDCSTFDDGDAARKCKWYQVGCHLTNLWNWIEDHFEWIATPVVIYSFIDFIIAYLEGK